ncbi:MAG: ribosomal protein [Candidatus Doudnabacteria bacterium]|nr:ribosomal protein [Candidatus Doudnabacteria bacterium]
MEKTITKKSNKKVASEAPRIKTVTASARYLRLSPRKVRLVTNLVKNMWAIDAVVQLEFVNKKPAIYVSDVIKSAIANGANNFNLRKESLFIKTITCDSGPKLKRYMPRAQGKASEIRRPLSHINVVLEERSGATKTKFNFTANKRARGPVDQEKTTKQEVAEEKGSKASIKSQIDKNSQEAKRSTPTQKRRLFNRKSGV